LSDLSRPFGALPPAADPAAAGLAPAAPGPFIWPGPPYASYPDGTPLTRPMLCDVVGINGTMTSGRLLNFVPEEGAIHVHMPPARQPIVLRFSQFQSLRVLEPIKPRTIVPATGNPHDELLAARPRSPYVLTLRDDNELQGETIGHEETPYGVFLFPPLDALGHVTRLFVPKTAYKNFEFGSKLGELLVESSVTTPAQVEAAFNEQQRLRKRKLGDILLTKQVVTPEQLSEALERQRNMPLVRIGDALQQLGMVSAKQVEEAVAEQSRDRSAPLGEILVRMGAVTSEDVQVALARKMGYPVVDLEKFPADPEALKKVPASMARRLQAVPLLLHDGRLVVALDNPARRRAALDEIEFIAQTKVLPVLAIGDSLEEHVARLYGASSLGSSASGGEVELFDEVGISEDKARLLESLEKDDTSANEVVDERQVDQSDNALVKMINTLILEAHGQKVSDIHIENYPGKDKIKIRFRKDGVLKSHLELPHTYRNALVARIKIMCDLDIAERRKPQDGKINFSRFVPGQKVELRVATIPTHSGCEDVVMRILASAKPIPLDKLGLSPYNNKNLKESMERPYGMVLCVGPTGSGKTTTLHSAMSFINTPERKIWTAEDPIEITQQGLRQVQVNAKIDWTFARALRAFLRADPDVVMVGEIRDRETAQMAVEASLTGHLVLSTLHTNSAPETVTRLLDMGMDPFNFADSLLAVLAQRLVRRICSACRVSRPATTEELDELLDDYLKAVPDDDEQFERGGVLRGWLERFGTDGRLMHHHSPGCEVCEKSGFKGRAGLHELMVVDKDIRRLVQTGKRAEDIQMQALRGGMRTLRQDGIEKVLQGICSIEEVRAISNA
jgi:type II secretory ATPase GspE/PulE/Tfp pilus assembly ATPase PilB-like protein